MANKTIKAAIAEALEDLSPENFNRFRHALRDRKEEPRVRRNKVENKDYLDIADVLVSNFTEDDAPNVTVALLRQIGCNAEADSLVKDLGGLPPKPDSSGIKEKGGPPSDPRSSDNEHFVDKYKLELIERVTNTTPILDELLKAKAIDHGTYDRIRAVPTSQDRLRELYSGCLKSGLTCKDIFYKILEKHEKFLISDLKNGK